MNTFVFVNLRLNNMFCILFFRCDVTINTGLAYDYGLIESRNAGIGTNDLAINKSSILVGRSTIWATVPSLTDILTA